MKEGEKVIFKYTCPEGHKPVLREGCKYWIIYLGQDRVYVNLPIIHREFTIWIPEKDLTKAERKNKC